MNELPGPDRTHTHDRRRTARALLPSERLSLLQRQQRPTSPARAMADALQLDEAARQEGFDDGAAGNKWDPQDLDVLAYSVGFWAGQTFGRGRRTKGDDNGGCL